MERTMKEENLKDASEEVMKIEKKIEGNRLDGRVVRKILGK
jgi:hypothetical protein